MTPALCMNGGLYVWMLVVRWVWVLHIACNAVPIIDDYGDYRFWCGGGYQVHQGWARHQGWLLLDTRVAQV